MKYEFSVEAAATELIELPEWMNEDQLLRELEAWVWDQLSCDIRKLERG